MKEFKHKIKFDKCVIGAALSEERDKILAIATLDNIRPFLPDVNTVENADLLPIAFDSCVVNKFNKNNHGIDTKTALEVAKNFLFKPIDIEHKRANVGGVILKYGFTSLSSHKILTEADLQDTTDPFYITLGGVIWREIKPELAQFIEECSDPSSPDYQTVSASWELLYDTCKLVLRDDNSRSIVGGELISDAEQIKTILDEVSKAGLNKYKNKKVYKLIDGNVLPVGIGLTETPAAEVKGVLTETSNIEATNKNSESSLDAKIPEVIEIVNKNENKISQSTILVVNESKETMKLANLDQLTDENLKAGLSAANIREFLEQKIEEADKLFKSAKLASEKDKTDTKEALDKLVAAKDELAKKLADTEKTLTEIQTKVLAAEAQKAFDIRMEYFDKNFELTNEIKKILAKEVTVLASETDFNSYVEKMKVLLPAKKQEVAKTEIKASEEVTADKVVDDAIKGAKITTATPLGTSVGTETQTLKEKYAAAFAVDQFGINLGKNRNK